MYNPIIIKHFTEPTHVGVLTSPDDVIELGNPICDDRLIMHLKFDEARRVLDAKYQAYGCATAVATGNLFCEYVLGKTPQEVLSMPEEEIPTMLGELAPSQRHCIELLGQLFCHFKGYRS